mmetsp:Transcript_15739/g.23695  ORF Transcript_15739/g.23695 Transcript_15739/m.23695 type:complete len:402 (+) Transcript_15739:3-1208(+)
MIRSRRNRDVDRHLSRDNQCQLNKSHTFNHTFRKTILKFNNKRVALLFLFSIVILLCLAQLSFTHCTGVCFVAEDAMSSSCGPWDSNRLLYMRIPKTGSTSFVRLIKSLSETKAFGFIDVGEWKDAVKQFEMTTMSREAGFIKTVANYFLFPSHSYNRTLIYGHFFFINWTNPNTTMNYLHPTARFFPPPLAPFGRHVAERYFGLRAPGPTEISKAVYISMVRNPRERIESMYYYERTSAFTPQWRSNFVKRFGNKSFTSCLLNPDCVKKNDLRRWCSLQTQFFCGMKHKDCRHPLTDASLQRAIRNLKERFLFVGLLERLNDSLTMFSRLLPTYFEGWRNIPLSHAKGRGTRSGEEAQPSTREKLASEVLKDVCLYDNTLYREAKELFEMRFRSCNQISG